MKLVVTIDRDPGAGVFREGDGGAPPLPDFAPAPAGWVREIETADELAGARQLADLRALSLVHPLLVLRIAIEPEGISVVLANGSFGEHDGEIAALIAWTGAGESAIWQPNAGVHEVLYASVALPADAHARFLALVRRQIPSTWAADALHVTTSAASIELGFELGWGLLRAVQVVGILQHAWAEEGGGARCVVELDGLAPIGATVHDGRGWIALEREILAAARTRVAVAVTPPAIAAPDEPIATWLDERGRCFALGADDAIAQIAARTEARGEAPPDGRHRIDGTWVVDPAPSVVRGGDGAWTLACGAGTMTLAADPACEREVLACSSRGVVVAERREGAVRFHACDELGTRSSIAIANVAAYAVAGHLEQVVASILDRAGGSHLATFDLARFAPAREAAWPATAEVTSLAILGRRTVVAAADGALFVIDLPTGELRRTCYVPCIDPQIVHVDRERDAVWLVGGGLTAREDLVRVELGRDRPCAATVATAGLAAAGWGALHAIALANGTWFLAYANRGVFRMTDTAIDEVAALAGGERVTGAAAAGVRFAATIAGPDGARLVIGNARPRSFALDPRLGSPARPRVRVT